MSKYFNEGSKCIQLQTEESQSSKFKMKEYPNKPIESQQGKKEFETIVNMFNHSSSQGLQEQEKQEKQTISSSLQSATVTLPCIPVNE